MIIFLFCFRNIQPNSVVHVVKHVGLVSTTVTTHPLFHFCNTATYTCPSTFVCRLSTTGSRMAMFYVNWWTSYNLDLALKLITRRRARTR